MQLILKNTIVDTMELMNKNVKLRIVAGNLILLLILPISLIVSSLLIPLLQVLPHPHLPVLPVLPLPLLPLPLLLLHLLLVLLE
jgi:hypothetical protein